MTTSDWPHPLDGVLADPAHHQVLFDNAQIRVVETIVRVGETTPLHTHVLPTVLYAVSGSNFIRRDARGAVLHDTRTAKPPFEMPRVQWSDGINEHTLENPGPDDLIVIGIELKHEVEHG
jgi:hypothetical protein